jgi:hypothetical protein
MAQQNTTATLDGLFKIVYGEGPVDAIPEIAIVQKAIKFQQTERIGKSYNFPVILTSEAGVTYLAAGAGVQTLNNAIAAQLKEASVDANQIIIRGQMDYEAAAKAASGGKAAFRNASELLVENLMETGSRRLEMAFIYGQSATGLGTAASSANVNTTNTNVQISAASWAPGMWAGTENAQVQFSVVSTGVMVSSAAIYTIVSVDYTNKKLKISGASGDITALDIALAAPCYITWNGAKTGTSTWVEPVGIDKIILNVGSLFGIDASIYGLWGGSSYDFLSGPVTTAKILNLSGLAVSKGGLMEESDLLLSPKTFTNLAGTMTDLRRQNGGQKETEGIGGYETIVLMGPGGKLNLVPHPMIKEGEVFLYPPKRFKRIGTQEFSFETPGRKGELFLHVPDKNAYELRLYGAQAIICTTPAKCVKGINIVNT